MGEMGGPRNLRPHEYAGIAAKLKSVSADASKGNWESLRYTTMTVERMRTFIDYISTTGNSVKCSQASVDFIETQLAEYRNYAEWRNDPKNAQAVQDGLCAGYAYLFASHLPAT